MQTQLTFLKGLTEYRRYMQRQYSEPTTHYGYEDLNLGLSYAYASYWKNSHVKKLPHPSQDPKGFSAAYLSASYFTSSPLVPTYWISSELLEAISHTTVALEHFHDLPIVHHKMALILPKGAFKTPFGTSVKALYWEHHDPHPSFNLSMGGKDLNFTQETNVLRQHHQLTQWQSLHIAAISENFATYFELFPLNPSHIQRLGIEHGGTHNEFGTKLRSLLFQILCLMSAHPQLFCTNPLERRLPQQISQRKLKRFYQKNRLIPPNWVGKNYRFIGQNNPSERSHSSPKSHLRRGHWRQQVCGTGGQQRKLIWIEPTAVNFGVSAD